MNYFVFNFFAEKPTDYSKLINEQAENANIDALVELKDELMNE